MKLDVEQAFFKYKLNVLDEFIELCKLIAKHEDYYKDSDQYTMTTGVDNRELEQYKVNGQVLANILITIDRLTNSTTLSLYEHECPKAYEILGIKGYFNLVLPVDKLLHDKRSYEEKWEILKNILEVIDKNESNYPLEEGKMLVKCIDNQLDNMRNIESNIATV